MRCNIFLFTKLRNQYVFKNSLRLYSVKLLQNNYVPKFRSKRFHDWSEANKEYNKIAGTQNIKTWIILGFTTIPLFITHSYLQLIRNLELHRLNKEMPTIRWGNFASEYLEKEQVSTIVYYPKYNIGHAYLKEASENTEISKPAWIDLIFQIFPFKPEHLDLNSIKPDVRFSFKGKFVDLEQAIQNSKQRIAKNLNEPGIYLELNYYPTKSDLSILFIVFISSIIIGSTTLNLLI